MVEGPEYSNDFTFFLVKINKELLKLEQGIPLADFLSLNCLKKVELQFKVLQKMTLHKDHVLNFFNSCDVQFHRLNRYKEILPFLHNRVMLKECPLIDFCEPVSKDNSNCKD